MTRAFLPMFAQINRYHPLRFAALTILFLLLSYMGSAVYFRASSITTVKPFVGVGLALCLIYGRSWLWPVLISGTIGGVLAKLALPSELINLSFSERLFDNLATPIVTSTSLLMTHSLLQRLIGQDIDFRAWRHLVRFIAIAALVSATTAFAFATVVHLVRGIGILTNWLSWFIPLSLSYVIFTPVIVLLATTEKRAFRTNCYNLAASLLLLAALLFLNFIPWGFPIFFAVPLAILVITMACGTEGAALGLMLTEIILTVATIYGHSLAGLPDWSPGYQLYFVQAYVSILIIVMLPVAAAITERRKLRDDMAAALLREEQAHQALRKSQHLEAVGKLTSGVAHDFNNLLTVILGNADVLEKQLAGDEHLHPLASLTKKAALRAAEHTKKLLAFSRQQALDVQALDINKVIAASDSLLRVAFGEQVKMKTILTPKPWLASGDSTQLESALLNLAVNARDAMPNGGSATIETRNISARDLAQDHSLVDSEEPLSGDYVLVSVSDTGTGMDEDTRRRAFEPFFTTKDVGMGTGLGLSMVYGFIRQLGGQVRIHSKPGQGATVELYLPRAQQAGGEGIGEKV